MARLLTDPAFLASTGDAFPGGTVAFKPAPADAAGDGPRQEDVVRPAQPRLAACPGEDEAPARHPRRRLRLRPRAQGRA
ncbi:hypothetical protein [Nocardioides convexus]|uniref:hypothetical protein n=1 Tax=Nocardioides convexus TaxID=2712224 RepID=UPI003100C1C4